MMWTELNEEWHLVKEQSTDGSFLTVETACGITSRWDGTFSDHLPGTLKACAVCATPGILDTRTKKTTLPPPTKKEAAASKRAEEKKDS